jgi:uncharacterized membrane protein
MTTTIRARIIDSQTEIKIQLTGIDNYRRMQAMRYRVAAEIESHTALLGDRGVAPRWAMNVSSEGITLELCDGDSPAVALEVVRRALETCDISVMSGAQKARLDLASARATLRRVGNRQAPQLG